MNAAMWTGAPMAADAYAAVRRATIFRWGKWDPQFEDLSVLCDFPIILRRSEWQRVAAWAEQLAAETLAAEEELVRRPDLHKWLGLPRAVRRVLSRAAACPPGNGPRVMRFDFHLTTDGWRITEVNSDVPGGFIEGSGFAREVAACFPSLRVAGDPAAAYAEAWALHHFLITTRLDDYVRYLQKLSEKPLMIYDTPEERLAEFRRAFGDDLSALYADFLRYVSGLR